MRKIKGREESAPKQLKIKGRVELAPKVGKRIRVMECSGMFYDLG